MGARDFKLDGRPARHGSPTATEAGRQGANLFKMKEHSRDKSLEMLSEYVRDQEAFRDHAAERFV